MTEKDPSQKIKLFGTFQEIMEQMKSGQIDQGEGYKKLMSAATEAGLEESESVNLLSQFIAAELGSSMNGGFTDLQEFDYLEPNSKERKRIASFAWWYTQFRVDADDLSSKVDPKKRMTSPYKRAAFELGNNDEETTDLLKWADQQPHKIASILAQSMITGELSTFHIPLLGDFIKKSVDGSLAPLELIEYTTDESPEEV